MALAVEAPEDIRDNLMTELPPGLYGLHGGHDGAAAPSKVTPPPGLSPHADSETTASWSPWRSFSIPEDLGLVQEPMLQATSLPREEWKMHFPPGFAGHDMQDKWQCHEPATVHLSDASTTEERYSSGSDDDPAYVASGPGSQRMENDFLSAENLRLAVENEMLRTASWAGAAHQGDMGSGSYWSGDGSSPSSMDQHTMEMQWAGMNPYMNPWSMMSMGDAQGSMWQWGAGDMATTPQKESRARTDSDVAACMQKHRGGSARDVGRSRTLSDVNDFHAVGEDYTGPYLTVMLRNLPNNYTRTMLVELIDSEGFAGQYDFIYLPMDFKSHASLGYAFVNLITSEQAMRFFEAFVGFHDWIVPSQKVCSVNWSAPYQGLDAHLERYRNSPVMHDDVPDDYKPMVFRDAVRIAFPGPTKKLKVPRMRVGHEKTTLSEMVTSS